MEKNLQELLYFVATSNLRESRRTAKRLLEANTKKCDEGIKNRLLPKLMMDELELPHKVKGLVVLDQKFDDKYVLDPKDQPVIDAILSTYQIAEQLKEIGIYYSNTALLHGIPGCGKTALAKQVAKTLNLPFIYLNFNQLICSKLGGTGANLQQVFDYANEAPCVLMLDEIDAISLRRGSDTLSEMTRIVINLMQCLDQLDHQTVVIAATNRFDMLDEALVRRFSVQHEVTQPSLTTKKQIVKNYLDKVPNATYNEEGIRQFLLTLKVNCTTDQLTKELIKLIIVSLKEGIPLTMEA